jgi:hypothetical protein
VKQKLVLFSLLVLISVVLSACAGQSTGFFNWRNSENSNNAWARYFEGTEGVNMRFSDLQAPPPRMFYDSTADPDDNAFIISIDVQNVGSAWSRGGLYVSGYDPSMIRIDDIDIPKLSGGWGDCVIDFGVVGGAAGFFNAVIGNVGCSETGVNIYNNGQDDWGFAINSLGQLFGNEDAVWSDVAFSFDQQGNNPQFQLSIDDNFNLDALNRGQGMLILLSGLDFARFNGKEYYLAPDDYNFPGGEQDTIIFEGQVRNWPRGLDATDRAVPFLVTNCFAYATYAAPQVCIDPSPFDQSINKVCRPREITFNGGNGAPVAVTSVEQENSRNSIFFTINIANLDNGRVYDMGYLEQCSPYYPGRVSPQALNKVYILDARIGNTPLFCTPDRGDGVRLVNGRGQFTCKYNLEYQTANSAYETPLIIELGYGYSQTIQRSMTIKRVI